MHHIRIQVIALWPILCLVAPALTTQKRFSPIGGLAESSQSCQSHTLFLDPNEAAADGLHTLKYQGLQREFRILRPDDYLKKGHTGRRSVILTFHGFGSTSAWSLAQFGELAKVADGPIVVALQGLAGNGGLGLPTGFNGAGSSAGSGPYGDTCTNNALTYPCHSETCQVCHRCAFTSCADDVGYVLAVLDAVENSLCVRPDQVFAVGFENGGQFMFELASDPRSAPRLNAVATLHGLPLAGFLRAPPAGDAPRLLGVWGGATSSLQGQVLPPLSNLEEWAGGSSRSSRVLTATAEDQAGWIFTSMASTTTFWGQVEDCTGRSLEDSAVAAVLAERHSDELTCVGLCGGHVLQCLRNARDHAFVTPLYSRLVWDFFVGNISNIGKIDIDQTSGIYTDKAYIDQAQPSTVHVVKEDTGSSKMGYTRGSRDFGKGTVILCIASIVTLALVVAVGCGVYCLRRKSRLAAPQGAGQGRQHQTYQHQSSRLPPTTHPRP